MRREPKRGNWPDNARIASITGAFLPSRSEEPLSPDFFGAKFSGQVINKDEDGGETYRELAERDRYFPITEGERARLLLNLGVSDIGLTRPGWINVTTLDNRYVFINAHQIERISTISDDAEVMPDFEHIEVYKLAREMSIDVVPSSAPEDDESPYSPALLARASELVNSLGDVAAEWLNGVCVDTAYGEREYFYLDDATFSDLWLVELDGQNAGDDSFVNLYAEGFHRSTFFRLGSLRLIEIPSDRYLEWLDKDNES